MITVTYSPSTERRRKEQQGNAVVGLNCNYIVQTPLQCHVLRKRLLPMKYLDGYIIWLCVKLCR